MPLVEGPTLTPVHNAAVVPSYLPPKQNVFSGE